MAPIGDGVAVNAGLGGGGIEVGAVQQVVDNLELRSVEGGIGHGSYLSATTIACERGRSGCPRGRIWVEVAWNEGEGNVLKTCDWLLAGDGFQGSLCKPKRRKGLR